MKVGDIYKITITEDNPDWAEGVSYLKLYQSKIGKTIYDNGKIFWECFWGDNGETSERFIERDKTFQCMTGGTNNRRMVKTNITFSEDWINKHGVSLEPAERDK